MHLTSQEVLLHFLGFQKFSKVHGRQKSKRYSKGSNTSPEVLELMGVQKGKGIVRQLLEVQMHSNTSPEVLELMGYVQKGKGIVRQSMIHV